MTNPSQNYQNQKPSQQASGKNPTNSPNGSPDKSKQQPGIKKQDDSDKSSSKMGKGDSC